MALSARELCSALFSEASDPSTLDEDALRRSWRQIAFLNCFQRAQLLDHSFRDCERFASEAAWAFCPSAVPVSSHFQRRRRCLSLGDSRLDAILGGGLFEGSLTEVFGNAGSGKTQFALTACVAAGLPVPAGGFGEDVRIVYVDTERRFSAERLIEIARARQPDIYAADAHAERQLDAFLSRVVVLTPDSQEDLLEKLEGLEVAMRKANAGLLVLDSVAYLTRKDYAEGALRDRQDSLVRVGKILKKIADACEAVVIVTNQVTTRATPFFTSSGSSRTKTEAALGNSWHHCVSTRLRLSKDERERENPRQSGSMRIEKSPIAPDTTVGYRIGASGVVFTPPGEAERAANR